MEHYNLLYGCGHVIPFEIVAFEVCCETNSNLAKIWNYLGIDRSSCPPDGVI